MWQVIETLDRVADGGKLYIAIYNHQPLRRPAFTRFSSG